MRNYLYIICLLCGISLSAYGQQGLYFSQYLQDATVFNPAYAGSQEALTLTAQYRHQWVEYAGAPRSQGFSAHGPVSAKKIGLGLRLTNDQMAGFQQQTLSPLFAYRIRISEKRYIAAGLQLSLIRQSPDFASIHLRQADDPVFAGGAAALSASFGTGVFYASEHFYAGFAVPALFPDLGGNFREPAAFLTAERTYIGHAGLVLDIHPEVKLKPNFLLAVPEKGNLYADANLLFLFREVLWLGGSYRLGQGIAALAQLQLNPQLALGYSFEPPFRLKSTLGVASHEISLQYRFYFMESAVKSPRYF